MNVKQIHYAELARDDYTTVGVQIVARDPAVYTYKVLKADLAAWGLKPGSPVLIPTPKHEVQAVQAPKSDGLVPNEEVSFPQFRVAIVRRVDAEARIDYNGLIQYKWILGPVDPKLIENFDNNEANDLQVVERILYEQQKNYKAQMRAALLISAPDLAKELGYALPASVVNNLTTSSTKEQVEAVLTRETPKTKDELPRDFNRDDMDSNYRMR